MSVTLPHWDPIDSWEISWNIRWKPMGTKTEPLMALNMPLASEKSTNNRIRSIVVAAPIRNPKRQKSPAWANTVTPRRKDAIKGREDHAPKDQLLGNGFVERNEDDDDQDLADQCQWPCEK